MFDLRRREFITLLGGAAVAWPVAARAQQTGKVYRIGYLGVTSYAGYAREIEALLSGLRRLGYETAFRYGPSAGHWRGSYARWLGSSRKISRQNVST